jgi:endo-1,4-beta-xylanase
VLRGAGIALLVLGGVLVAAAAVLVLLLVIDPGGSDNAPRVERPTSPTAPLRASAAPREMLVGAAVSDQSLHTELPYARTLASEYNALTPENAMKWGTIHPAQDTYDFGPADAIVGFARAHRMAVRGHTLVWYREVPSWVTDRTWTRSELEQVLRDHIHAVVGHYRGEVAQWDVVNEAVDSEGKLRDNVWLRAIGPKYIDLAFRWAHEADPAAKLYYNDFDLEVPGKKAQAVDKLVRGLVARGVPIDGVGIQGHQVTTRPRPRRGIETALRRYARMGLDVAITEFDVGINLPTDAAKLTQQAHAYRDALAACLAVDRCRTFVTWGFTDKHSWIPGVRPGYGDGLPFDASYGAKPAAEALRATLARGH